MAGMEFDPKKGEAEFSDMAAVKRLLVVQRRHPDLARQAGAIVWSRASSRIDHLKGESRDWIRKQLAWLEEGFECARSGQAPEANANPAVGNAYELFSRLRDQGHDLLGSAVDLYAADVAPRLCAKRVEFGVKTTVAEVEKELRDGFTPEMVSHYAATPCHALSHELIELLRPDGTHVRSLMEWWELLVLFLVIEVPELDPSDVGIPVELPRTSDGASADEDLFKYREDMKEFLGLIFSAAVGKGYARYNAVLRQTGAWVGDEETNDDRNPVHGSVVNQLAQPSAPSGHSYSPSVERQIVSRLTPSVCAAWSLYEGAVERLGEVRTDMEIWDYLKEEELIAHSTNLATFSRYLRRARSALGKQKNMPRLPLPMGADDQDD